MLPGYVKIVHQYQLTARDCLRFESAAPIYAIDRKIPFYQNTQSDWPLVVSETLAGVSSNSALGFRAGCSLATDDRGPYSSLFGYVKATHLDDFVGFENAKLLIQPAIYPFFYSMLCGTYPKQCKIDHCWR